MLIVTVAIIAAVVGVWQLVHRASPLVRRWHPSSFPRRTSGLLSVLDSGSTGRPGAEVLVMLHGLGATGDYFGAFYDGLSRQRRVVIIDLLGFGHSLDDERDDFGVDAHVDALDRTLEALELDAGKVILAAHSMSSAVAMTWAAQHRDRVGGVYLWGPPIYPAGTAEASVGREYGMMGRLFALNTGWAERVCRINCANRELSGRAMALMAPRWPTQISSEASRHTWEAYNGSLRSLILEFDWTTVFPTEFPVTIFRGSDDPIGDREFIASLVGDTSVVTIPGADHHIALEHPELLFDALDAGRS